MMCMIHSHGTILLNGHVDKGNSNSPWARWKWDLDFQGISRANVFLDGMTKASFGSPDKNRYIAEAKF